MTLKKIEDNAWWARMHCQHLEHRPPDGAIKEPGLYEWTCPGCGHVSTLHCDGPKSVEEKEVYIVTHGEKTFVVSVWRWEDAPEDYRRLSGHGGDEDFVALVSEAMIRRGDDLFMFERMANDVTHHPLADGSLILIGAHS